MKDEYVVARIFLEINAAHFYSETPFRFTSGVLSPTYVDCRKLISFPKQRNITLDIAVKRLKKLNLDKVDCIAGGETAGIPFAAFLAERLNLPMIYIRKQPKGFGKGQQIEGFLKQGSRVLLVEDLLFDAGSKLKFASVIENELSTVEYLFCVFSYGLKVADERLKKAGLHYFFLTDWPTLLTEAKKTGYFSSKQARTVKEFLKNPTEWAAKHGYK
ncbi:MAG: orotate phosphoribosyltransferase [Thermodesulfovibrionales bacterium]|nr:orotate phosphoribosyltransferase [Thermodesulfovibrionales bacterium]